MGTLDPLGLPLATDVVSGEQADDRLYWPIITRNPRSACHGPESRPVSVAPDRHHAEAVGAVEREALDQVRLPRADSDESVVRSEMTSPVFSRVSATDSPWSGRSACSSSNRSPLPTRNSEGCTLTWTGRKPSCLPLTPPRGPGKRQVDDEATLQARIDKILTTQQVEDFFTVRYERQVERHVKYVGRGRGGPNRPHTVEERGRYQMTSILVGRGRD